MRHLFDAHTLAVLKVLDQIDFPVGIAVEFIAHKHAGFVMAFLIGDAVFVVIKLLAELATKLVEIDEHVLASIAV